MQQVNDVFVDETSVLEGAAVGAGTKIWHFCHIMAADIGKNCSIGQNCFIADGVTVGDNCKIQNNVSLYKGVTVEDDVFIGPSAVFTNVRKPKADSPVSEDRYQKTIIRKGASIGANATIVCGVEIGENATVGAGAVITKDVPAGLTVIGNPAGILIKDHRGKSFVVDFGQYYVRKNRR